MARVHVGTCSWTDYEGFYPPELPSNQQIAYYSERFTVVELDSSFYRIMPARNYQLWSSRTPEGFLFDVKPFRQLSWHDRETPPNAPVFDEFRRSIRPLHLSGKLGAVSFQFPPWFRYDSRNVAFIETLPSIFPEDRVCVEFRHRSWLEDSNQKDVVAALRAARVGLTVVDEPQVGSGTVPTVLAVTLPDLVIVRLHGRNAKKWYAKVERAAERFDYLYSEDELREWVPRLSELAQEARNIHVLFNNNWRAYSIRNALQMRRMLTQAERPELEVALPARDEPPPDTGP